MWSTYAEYFQGSLQRSEVLYLHFTDGGTDLQESELVSPDFQHTDGKAFQLPWTSEHSMDPCCYQGYYLLLILLSDKKKLLSRAADKEYFTLEAQGV